VDNEVGEDGFDMVDGVVGGKVRDHAWWHLFGDRGEWDGLARRSRDASCAWNGQRAGKVCKSTETFVLETSG